MSMVILMRVAPIKKKTLFVYMQGGSRANHAPLYIKYRIVDTFWSMVISSHNGNLNSFFSS